MYKLNLEQFNNIMNSKPNRLENCDLTDLDFLNFKDLLIGPLNKQEKIESWTDNVKWPETITKTINPQKILEDAKHPTEMDSLHKRGLTGHGINIAIIDQKLYLEHPEYKDQIKHYELVGVWPKYDHADYHGSLVTGCAVGKTTGTAPDANIYYFAANNWANYNTPFIAAQLKLLSSETLKDTQHRLFENMAIKRVLEINNTLPENEKIRFLSCSWGRAIDQFYKESVELLDECEKNGIMVIGAEYKNERNKTYDGNIRYPDPGKPGVLIPTNEKTTPYFRGGYVYSRDGGLSSTYPYIAGVFACALQNNQLFFTRPNWQDELFDILYQTASQTSNGARIINPDGIEQRVSEITHEMQNNLIKQQRLKNE